MAIGEVKVTELENTAVVDDTSDLNILKDTTEGGLRRYKKIKAIDLRSYMHQMTTGRTAFQELTSAALSTSGWYTIAEMSVLAGAVNYAGDLTVCSGLGGVLGCEFAGRTAGSVRNSSNTTINLVKPAGFSGVQDVTSFRLAVSDVAASGIKLQMYTDSLTTYTIGLSQNISRGALAGLQLVSPYLDNTPTLPDGSTTATFIEAGAELSLETNATYTFPNICGYKASADQMRCVAAWPEIPKQGTSLEITLPSASLRFYGGGANVTLDGTETISDFVINGKYVSFRVNSVGAYSTLSGDENYLFWVAGAGCKLTIT